MNRNVSQGVGQVIGMVDGHPVVGLDIAKNVFQLHTVQMQTGEVVNMSIKRAKVLEYFSNRRPCLIGIEACGSAHHWARELTALGHRVRLIHARAVRPFVLGNKTDASDARAIWQAVQQPGVRFVGIKTLDVRITQRARTDVDMKRILSVPGVGALTASAAIATMGQASAFKSGREFAAWLGLVPRQVGTGGRVKLLGISKRGDSYLRTLLIHGARAVFSHSKEPGAWVAQLKVRRPANVVIVALAAKIARTIWALTAKEQDYQRGYRSLRPQVA